MSEVKELIAKMDELIGVLSAQTHVGQQHDVVLTPEMQVMASGSLGLGKPYTGGWKQWLDDWNWVDFADSIGQEFVSRETRCVRSLLESIGEVMLYMADQCPVRSLCDVLHGFGLHAHEAASNFEYGDFDEINWEGGLRFLSNYLVDENSEAGKSNGVTFAEFCEGVARMLQGPLASGGAHLWVSPFQKSPRVPINMQQVFHYAAYFLIRYPIWHGEGIGRGEDLPPEVSPIDPDADTPWSMPGDN